MESAWEMNVQTGNNNSYMELVKNGIWGKRSITKAYVICRRRRNTERATLFLHT